MKLSFTKMQGAGNDFIVAGGLSETISLSDEQIRALCHRRFGVGGDGVLLLGPASDGEMDARMIYYNADGSRGEMCGNGARCFTAYALGLGLGREGRVRFETDAGPITATAGGGEYTLEMTPPFDFRLRETVQLAAGKSEVHYLNTGVPHVVKFVSDVDTVDIRREGAELRRHPAFAPKGANVNFARINPDGPILVRTYERGVEDETLACGTGVTATAIAAHMIHGVDTPVKLRVAGRAVLTVGFERAGEEIRNVTLTGPAETVFTGQVEL